MRRNSRRKSKAHRPPGRVGENMCKILNGVNWFLIIMAGFGVLSLCLSGCITLATALQGRAKIKLIQDHYEHEERKKH